LSLVGTTPLSKGLWDRERENHVLQYFLNLPPWLNTVLCYSPDCLTLSRFFCGFGLRFIARRNSLLSCVSSATEKLGKVLMQQLMAYKYKLNEM
jgi:hypothetical protein